MIKKGPIPAYLFDFIYLCSMVRAKFAQYDLTSIVIDELFMSNNYINAVTELPGAESFTSLLDSVTSENILTFDWILTKDS